MNRHRLGLAVLTAFASLLVLGTPVRAQTPKEDPKPNAAQPKVDEKAEFAVEGKFVEACTCKATCQAEVTGEATGCQAMGAFQLDKGTYDGADISGTRVAFACTTDALYLYLDAPDAKRAALEKFTRAVLAAYGPVKKVSAAKIAIEGKDGKYDVRVGDGKVMDLSTEPVLGGDHKTAVEIGNTQNLLNPTFWQGKCDSGHYKDGDVTIDIDGGRNSFFDEHMKAGGKA